MIESHDVTIAYIYFGYIYRQFSLLSWLLFFFFLCSLVSSHSFLVCFLLLSFRLNKDIELTYTLDTRQPTYNIQSLTFNIQHILNIIHFAKKNCNGTLPNLTHLKIMMGRQCSKTGTKYTLGNYYY